MNKNSMNSSYIHGPMKLKFCNYILITTKKQHILNNNSHEFHTFE